MSREDRTTSETPEHDLTVKALRFLAAREHSVKELRGKLGRGRTRGGANDANDATDATDATVETVLETLQRDGYLSDSRFAEAFVRSRTGRGQGPAKIRAGLIERGVPRELVDAALDLDGNVWRELAEDAHARRFGPAPPADRRDWARRARFLSTRGFPSEVVYRTLGEQPV